MPKKGRFVWLDVSTIRRNKNSSHCVVSVVTVECRRGWDVLLANVFFGLNPNLPYWTLGTHFLQNLRPEQKSLYMTSDEVF